MGSLSTKQKILNASTKLFNEQGVANVRLQHIADEIGISVGNLAYHYKNKDAILLALYEDLTKEANEILSSFRTYPNLFDFDHQLNIYFQFLQKYPFYFIDIVELERNHSKIHKKRQQQICKMIAQLKSRMEYNIKRGIIVAQLDEQQIEHIAITIWSMITFWLQQNMIRKINCQDDIYCFKKMIWQQIRPHLTQKGLDEFNMLIIPLLSPVN